LVGKSEEWKKKIGELISKYSCEIVLKREEGCDGGKYT
jgi:hypothetical protein